MPRKRIVTVRDVQGDPSWELISNSQDIDFVGESLGYSSKHPFSRKYGCLFVKRAEDDRGSDSPFIHVLGCEDYIPWLTSSVDYIHKAKAK